MPAEPAEVQHVSLTLDAYVSDDVMPFWRAVLGYDHIGPADLADRRRQGPAVTFQDMQTPRTERSRLHIDVSVPHDQAEALTMADLVAVMNNGVLQQIATPGEIYERPANRFVATFVGSPAMSVCTGFGAGGLPLSMQLIAKPFQEPTLFRVGHAYESAMTWRRKRPALAEV